MRTELAHWWRIFLGIGDETRRVALDILRQRYVDESEHARQFTRHAGEMHYPQFREKLLHIAAEETEHAGLLAKKIFDLGGKLPEVTGERASTEQSSWQHLLKDLNEEGHLRRRVDGADMGSGDGLSRYRRIARTDFQRGKETWRRNP